MKILVVGRSASAHALAWKAAQSPLVERVFVAPGNAGTAGEPKTENIDVATQDVVKLAAFAREKEIDLTIVGPAGPLAAGVVDEFERQGLKVFGPTQRAAQLECSKDFAKRFLLRHRIPTPVYQAFSDEWEAKAYVATRVLPIVIKADGFSAERGQGVVVARSSDEANSAIEYLFGKARSFEGGQKVLVEDFLVAEEVSFTVIVDGKSFVSLADSRDYKRLRNGDAGPNTEGMGAYSPAIDSQLHQTIVDTVVQPTVNGLLKDGIRYRGFLYFGLMVDSRQNVSVLEFNCRLGDPEAVTILSRLSTDFVALLASAMDGNLGSVAPEWMKAYSLVTYLVAPNYPASVSKGHQITLPNTSTCKIFHSGTRSNGAQLLTDGGRILAVNATAESIDRARTMVYDAVPLIKFDGATWREDIGLR
jgi:phosphoribosylamine--glycine ligase